MTDIRVPPILIAGSRILLVGEAPGEQEAHQLQPFVGAAGHELTKMLHDAGIIRAECSITNVCKYRPPNNDISAFFFDRDCFKPGEKITAGLEELANEIKTLKPNIVVAFGDTALWALTGHRGIGDWRGSLLECTLVPGVKILPTYHPAGVLRMYEWRPVVVHDLRRVLRESAFPEIRYPSYNFILSAPYMETLGHIQSLINKASDAPLRLSVDIETIRHEIACVGIAWSARDALCIPLRTSREYWSIEEELNLVLKMQTLFTHPNVQIIGQNFLYDTQYFAWRYGFVPNTVDDTMFMQHVAFAGMPKDLSFLSSMYCDFHQHWKEDLKDYKRAPTDDLKFFAYNAKDCVITYEVADVLTKVLSDLRLQAPYAFQMKMWYHVLWMMLRGVRIDLSIRNQMAAELMAAAEQREKFIEAVVGYQLNPRSAKQMHKFLYEELGFNPLRNRKSGKITANFEALRVLAERWSPLQPIVDALLDLRSIGVFLSTFVQARLDSDNRLRCSFNPAGTETFRLSSSENAFGNGTNLQNIPQGDRKKGVFNLPNIRRLFVPDQGYTYFDIDLDRADLQVVVWEANDTELKRLLRMGVDLHIKNGADLDGIDVPVDELIESHPNYPEHKARYKLQRQFAKSWVHGTNYGGSPRTMALAANCTVHKAEQMQKRWFDLHPGIKEWHRRTEAYLRGRRYITNRFGYRRFYPGRVDGLLPEALAWQPQSTVACIINRAIDNISTTPALHEVIILLQVHDSCGGQYPTIHEAAILPHLHKACLITVPYEDPLVIPVGIKTSTKSWGDCKATSWGTNNGTTNLHVVD